MAFAFVFSRQVAVTLAHKISCYSNENRFNFRNLGEKKTILCNGLSINNIEDFYYMCNSTSLRSNESFTFNQRILHTKIHVTSICV